MTQPKYATTTDDGRTYLDPTATGEHEKLDSVTTIIKAGAGAKVQLEYWKGQTTVAACALNHDDKGRWLEGNEKQLARASQTAAAKAADRGDLVHAGLERYIRTGKLVRPSATLDGPAALAAAPYFDQLEGFLETYAFEVITCGSNLMTEVSVFNHSHRYAGTGDLWARVAGHGAMLLDLKTSKGIYAETGLQLAALRYAEFAVLEDADGEPFRAALPDVETCGAILITENSFELIEVEAGEREYAEFLRRRQGLDWQKGAEKRTVVGPMRPPKMLALTTASPRLAELKQKVKRLIGAGHGQELADSWPEGLPMLKGTHKLTDSEVLAIEYHVRTCWSKHEDDISFDDSDLSDWLTERHEHVALLLGRLRALPADLAAAVEAACTRAGVSLVKGTTERGYVYACEAVDVAETEHRVRGAFVEATLHQIVDDSDLAELLPAILHTSLGREARLPMLTDLEVERVEAVCTSVSLGFAQFMWKGVSDERASVEPAATVIDMLVDTFGDKRAATAAAKAPAKKHRLAAPRSVSTMAADVLVTGLAVQSQLEGTP